MSMFVRYSGGFHSKDGVSWRCDILQESDVAFKIGQLSVPSKEPLLIEWNRTDKNEVICGSTATLVIVSPGDRTYADLYTIRPGDIRLDVYREGSLFWSGCLDTEFYQEPFESDSGYDVSLTFSDFGVLDRIPYDLEGMRTLDDLVKRAIVVSGINVSYVDSSLISTSFPDGMPMSLASLSIASANFYDEENQASTWWDVLEGILQPLALRIIQKTGKVYVYDINALYSTAPKYVEWVGDSSTLGTDNVYNNVTVTFSPYSKARLSDSDLEYPDIYGPEWTNLTSERSGVRYYNRPVPAGMASPECYSFYVDYDSDHKHGSDWDYSLIGFSIFLADQAKKVSGVKEIGTSNRAFKILPMLGGQERSGIAAGFRTGHFSVAHGGTFQKLIDPADHGQSLAFSTERTYITPLSSDERSGYFLRIRLDMLFDPRYNPEESPGDGNEGGNYDMVKSYCQFAFVPVAIVVYDNDGNALWHYSNRWLVDNGQPGNSVSATAEDAYTGLWGWKAGEASWGEAWLSWYDPDDLVEGTGVLGWQANRQNIGKPWTTGNRVSKRKYHYVDKNGGATRDFWMFDSFKRLPDGQYIPYPPEGGYLEVRVYNGVWACDDTERFAVDGSGKFNKNGLYKKTRWTLYGLPEVSVVRNTLILDDADSEDVEYSGELNKYAREPLDIETVCGTTDQFCPAAMGIYKKTSDGSSIRTLTRGGVTDHPEQLLIGTLYSQYADRKTSLSGDMAIDPEGLSVYVDRAVKNTRFMMLSEVADVKFDSSETTLVEVRPDEYIGKD